MACGILVPLPGIKPGPQLWMCRVLTHTGPPENSEDLLSIVSIWKFSIQILLKPCLKGFEHNLTSMGSKRNCLCVTRYAFIEQLVSPRGCEK